jgi:AmmeMemoRadiSam system protein A
MSSNTTDELPAVLRQQLLEAARASIEYGIRHGRPMAINPADYPESLTLPRATFVTLHIDGRLRGCIGSLEAHQSLIEDVAHNAHAAAFKDPRFPPLAANELEQIDIEISVLSPPEDVSFTSEADLLSRIRPGIDGLILSEGQRRGTFLPSVWSSLAEPVDFLRHLKQKAGLPPDYWSDSIRIQRYTTESFS